MAVKGQGARGGTIAAAAYWGGVIVAGFLSLIRLPVLYCTCKDSDILGITVMYHSKYIDIIHVDNSQNLLHPSSYRPTPA